MTISVNDSKAVNSMLAGVIKSASVQSVVFKSNAYYLLPAVYEDYAVLVGQSIEPEQKQGVDLWSNTNHHQTALGFVDTFLHRIFVTENYTNSGLDLEAEGIAVMTIDDVQADAKQHMLNELEQLINPVVVQLETSGIKTSMQAVIDKAIDLRHGSVDIELLNNDLNAKYLNTDDVTATQRLFEKAVSQVLSNETLTIQDIASRIAQTTLVTYFYEDFAVYSYLNGKIFPMLDNYHRVLDERIKHYKKAYFPQYTKSLIEYYYVVALLVEKLQSAQEDSTFAKFAELLKALSPTGDTQILLKYTLPAKPDVEISAHVDSGVLLKFDYSSLMQSSIGEKNISFSSNTYNQRELIKQAFSADKVFSKGLPLSAITSISFQRHVLYHR